MKQTAAAITLSLTMGSRIQFIQLNMNRAGLAAVCLNERIKRITGDFICLLTEPHNYGGKVASLPRNCKYVPNTLKEKECRAAIIASKNIEIVAFSIMKSSSSYPLLFVSSPPLF